MKSFTKEDRKDADAYIAKALRLKRFFGNWQGKVKKDIETGAWILPGGYIFTNTLSLPGFTDIRFDDYESVKESLGIFSDYEMIEDHRNLLSAFNKEAKRIFETAESPERLDYKIEDHRGIPIVIWSYQSPGMPKYEVFCDFTNKSCGTYHDEQVFFEGEIELAVDFLKQTAFLLQTERI